MDTLAIQAFIDAGQRQEQALGALRARFAADLKALRERLVLPPEAPLDALIAFVTRYVASAPGSLRMVAIISKRGRFFTYAAAFLYLAEDYFLQPLPAPEGSALDSSPLEALLERAFLTHRALEELSDKHQQHLHLPLVPQDMTEANAIAHHLLGDALALPIEQLIRFTKENQLRFEHVWQTAELVLPVEPLREVELPDTPAGDVRLRLAS